MMRAFVESKWGDLIGLVLVLLGTGIAAWAFRDDPKSLGLVALGMINAGYMALKLRSAPANSNGAGAAK